MLQATNEKRQRKPLPIVNPDTKTAVVVAQPASVAPVPTATTTTTTSETRPVESRTDSVSVAPPVKTTENTIKVQDDFRRQVARTLDKSNDENSSNNLSVKATAAAAAAAPRAKSPTPVASSTSKESTTSQSSTLSDPASQAYPGIRTGNIPEEKVPTPTPTPATKVNVDEPNKVGKIKATVNMRQGSSVHFLSVLFCSFSRQNTQSARVVLSYVTARRKIASQFSRRIAKTFVFRTS